MAINRVVAEPIAGKVKQDIAIISSVGAHVVGQYVLLRIADGSGHEGLGEASVTCVWSGETQAGVITLVEQEIKPILLGADPFDTEWILKRMERAIHAN